MRKALAPKVSSLRVRSVRVPMQPPHRTASGVVSESPLVLTDAMIDDGTVGHSVVFTYTPAALKPTADLIRNFEALVKDDLVELLVQVAKQKPLKAARDKAILLLGFAGAFRRSELVALRMDDITPHAHGIELLIRRPARITCGWYPSCSAFVVR